MVNSHGMRGIGAKQADVVGHHLEVRPALDDWWEWEVLGKNHEQVAYGIANSLQDAQGQAEDAAGGAPAQWTNLGPEPIK